MQKGQELPDFEALLNGFFKKFSRDPRNPVPDRPRTSNTLIGLGITFLLVVVLGLSGFYTVGESKQGVVTRLGKFLHIKDSGLCWNMPLIDTVRQVDVGIARQFLTSGVMLTRDENVVQLELKVQYRVIDPVKYLYSVVSADDSLRQATDSALRYVVGHTPMDELLTHGRDKVRQDTHQLIRKIIDEYDMGLQIKDVNFESARPPEAVKAAFDDAISAQEDEQRFIREAEAYARKVEPEARGEAHSIQEAAEGYKAKVILEATGEVAQLKQLLDQYLLAPKLVRQRLYIETMEALMERTPKILLDEGKNQDVLLLSLDALRQKASTQLIKP